MKKKLMTLLAAGMLLVPTHIGAESGKVTDAQLEKIQSIYENVTVEGLLEDIQEYAAYEGITEAESAEIIYEELAEQQRLYEEEDLSDGVSIMNTVVIASSAKGNIFYETSKTSGIAHGHVGMYYSAEVLVESTPSRGVYSLARTNKRVDPGARIMSVSNLTTTTKSSAADWAYGRRGESYSYNFATNRATSCYGDKNCSKLVWCAFRERASGLDLDSNGGAGVYPKDVRDHSRTLTVRQY